MVTAGVIFFLVLAWFKKSVWHVWNLFFVFTVIMAILAVLAPGKSEESLSGGFARILISRYQS
jgi:hypothetical protein